MPSQVKSNPSRFLITLLVITAALCVSGKPAAAQEDYAPKWELYAGYSFLYPNTYIHGVLPQGILPVSSGMESNPRGVGGSITYDFNRWFGLTLDASTDFSSGETTVAKRIDDTELTNFSFGPKFTFRHTHFSPFLEVLVGDQRLMPEAFHHIDRLGAMAGAGLDLRLSRHFAWRMLRADYVFSNYRYGPAAITPSTDLRAVRLQSGLVYTFGGEAPGLPPSAVCSVQPTDVFAGEPVTATARGSNFNPKRTVRYSWSGSGVKVGGSEASAQIDTAGLQPGAYQVTANLSDDSKRGVASCSARFTIKEPRPPTISCSPDPGSVPIGGSSTITAVGRSADGRSLTYNYTVDAGTIAGNGTTATLSTTGAQPGTITVTCNAADDRNPPLTASSTTTVTVQAPPPPSPDVSIIEKRLALHSIYFATARPTKENPDGGLLPSQEKTLTTLAADFATYLQSKPDAHLTLEGHADPRGSVEYNQALSERRVDRTRRFLIAQGIPAGSIDTKAFGKQQNLTDAEVRDAVERNPELSSEDKQRELKNIRVIALASNRRVDITLSIPGQNAQTSIREYPFNAADSLTLLDTRGGTKKNPRPTGENKK